jgi:hypothetical protein
VFTPIAPAATETPRVVPAPPTRVTGAIETPHAHGWSSMLAGAARSYGVLLLLLIAALALRLLVSWSWRDQRALRLACSD